MYVLHTFTKTWVRMHTNMKKIQSWVTFRILKTFQIVSQNAAVHRFKNN